MKHPFYITSCCSPKRSMLAAVTELVSAGFTQIELTGGTNFPEFSEEKLLLYKIEHNLDFLIHNYFPPPPKDFAMNLASGDKEISQQTLALIGEALRLSRKFSKSVYSLHAGFTFDLVPPKEIGGTFTQKDQKENSREHFFQALRTISANILPQGFRLALENAFSKHGKSPFSMLSTPEEIFEYLHFAQDYSNLGFLLDFGHLNIAAFYRKFPKEAFLEKLFSTYAHKIFEIHVSSNDGSDDTHGISSIDSFEIQFLRKHFSNMENVPIVMEWQQSVSPKTFLEFKRVEDFLYQDK